MAHADISALNNLIPTSAIDLDKIVAKKPFQLPRAGRYSVRAPESFPPTVFRATAGGHLQVQIDPTIVGPTGEGHSVRFQRVSAKTFDDNGVPTSMLGRYLRACGVTGTIPGDPQEQANLVASTAGAVYEVELDWEAHLRSTGETLKGMKNFPQNPDGTYQSWVDSTVEKDEDGQPRRIFANLTIKRFYPKS